jgi:hypothetical protein
MPPPEMDLRFQDAVLWEAHPSPDSFGQVRVIDPVDLKVRWVPTRREIADGKGGIILLDAQAVVYQNVPVGSIMWLGTVDDWDESGLGVGTGNTEDAELYIVQTFKKASDVKNIMTRYELGLQRYKQELPAIVS